MILPCEAPQLSIPDIIFYNFFSFQSVILVQEIYSDSLFDLQTLQFILCLNAVGNKIYVESFYNNVSFVVSSSIKKT